MNNFNFSFQGEPVKMEFSSKTSISEVAEYVSVSIAINNIKIFLEINHYPIGQAGKLQEAFFA